MRKTIVYGLATVVLGAALAIGLGTQARAAAPVNYSGACAEVFASDGLVQKAVTRAGVYHRSARRTSRRVYRRHHY
jgi:hypothetical protein